MSYLRELAVAREALEEAGANSLRLRKAGIEAENKSDNSPVTIADKQAEAMISAAVEAAFPDDGVLGEEGASREGRSGRRWIIDPIDGTRDFVRGNPLWASLIGLEDCGEVVAGVAYFPALRRMYWASLGDGAYLDGERIHCSRIGEISRSVVCPSGLGSTKHAVYAPRLIDFLAEAWAVRSLGGSLDAMLLAQGQAEVWIEPKVAPWDLAASKIILEEAGAKFFDLKGENTIYGGSAVACVPGVEAAVRRFIGIA